MTDEDRKIGEVAAATGLTVRTLHHYEDIGLLVASRRTEAGHRLYSGGDIERLYRISLLRRLGLSLAAIGQVLGDPAWDLRAALTRHLAELDRRLEVERTLRAHLSRMVSNLDADGPPSTDLLEVLEEMTMLDTAIERRISILVYEDIEAAHDHLVRVFGLGPGPLTRDDDGRVVHGEVHAGDGVVWLHQVTETYGLASPRTLGAATATTAIMVEDVDAHFRHAKGEGAEIVYEPVDQPYGYREYSARDLEGGLWSFMKPLD